ncbi:hypothetical protein MPER_15997, partial [Moniliophthora perniciosa FA553]
VQYNKHPIRFAEVQFYFRLKTEIGFQNLALLSLFRPPNEELRRKSHGTLLVCSYHGEQELVVAPATCILSVIAMVPYPHTRQDNLYFVVEKLGHIMGDESPPDAPEDEEEGDEDR